MPLAFRTGLLTDFIFYTALFIDLSTAAFAAAVYLRIINTEKNHRLSSCHQIKNSPLKTISVPRLELSNALLLARLMHFAHSALNLECHCWMDSAITLVWLSQLPSLENLCRQSCFGCAITPSVWSFVASYFDAHQSYELRISWSRSQSFRDTCFMIRPFMASSSRVLAELMPSNVSFEQRSNPPYVPCTPNWDFVSRYSLWPKLLRTTAYLYRFLNRLWLFKNPQANIAILLPEKIQNAKRYWLKIMQSIMFPDEIAALIHKRLIPKNSPLFLNSYMENLFVFENDSIEVASQERREIPSSYIRIRC